MVVVPQPKPPAGDEFAPLDDFRPAATSGKAIASFVLGLLSAPTCCLTSIPAALLGMFGLIDINNPKKNLKGKWIAISGLVMGCLGSILLVFAIPIAVLLPAVQAAREAARRAQCVNNMKQIGLAILNYESTNGCFPPAATYDASGKPLLSWRVLILPYMEQSPLFGRFHLDEPWDSPNNKPLSDVSITAFRCPSEVAPAALTTYQVFVDPRSLFTGEPTGVAGRDVPDGNGSTILVVEGANPVPWSKPDELSVESLTDPALGAGSKHPGGFNVLMADGSVRFFKSSPARPFDRQQLEALITRNGHEPVTVP